MRGTFCKNVINVDGEAGAACSALLDAKIFWIEAVKKFLINEQNVHKFKEDS